MAKKEFFEKVCRCGRHFQTAGRLRELCGVCLRAELTRRVSAASRRARSVRDGTAGYVAARTGIAVRPAPGSPAAAAARARREAKAAERAERDRATRDRMRGIARSAPTFGGGSSRKAARAA